MTARITQISRIRGYRIFRDFVWPSDLLEFARFNLIYGWNGTGKTVLSELFRHLETKQPIELADGEVQFMVGGIAVSGGDIPNAAIPQVRVFNRDSVDRTIFEVPSQQLPAVYYLGEDSVEKQKQVVARKDELDRRLAQAVEWERARSRADTDFERFCTDQARQIKDLLLISGGGPYRNYQAPRFKAAAENLLQASQPLALLSEDVRRRHLATKEGSDKGRLEPLAVTYPDVATLTHEVEAMLKSSVISSSLPGLVADPAVGEWVGQGLALHTGEHATDDCRFCGQPMPAGRLERLEAHFSDRFRELVGAVDEMQEVLGDAASLVGSLSPHDARLLYPHLQDEYGQVCKELAQQSRLGVGFVGALRSALLAKRGDPFAPREFRPSLYGVGLPAEDAAALDGAHRAVLDGEAVSETLGEAALLRVNALIEAHNKYTDAFEREVGAARTALENDRVARALSDYRTKKKALDDAAAGSIAARSAADAIKSEITQLELSIGQHQKPAAELNREMAAYLGRDELRFEVQEAGYTITRNGQSAMNLSEGERTAIAFMYFLKSLQSMGFRADPGVIVIDDPVSSLDANSLYSAFGFMKNRTGTAHQLFVLTHNFTFFRQVRSWFRYLPKETKKDARFYMLECQTNDGQRESIIRQLDPLLHRYESEYHYLFKRVYDKATRSTDDDALAQFYEMPNIARRLLEAFLAFRAPELPSETALLNRLDHMTFTDPSDRFRIERFLHLGSHFDRVGDPEHDLSTLSETRAVLLNILACMEQTDPEHYKGMLTAIGDGGT